MRGGPAPSEVLLKLVEVLEDGEWHSVSEVHDEVGKAIPPGVARRAAEVQRRSSKPQSAERVKPASDAQLVRTGRRAKTRDLLAKFQPGVLEFDPDRGEGSKVRMLQLPPRVVAWRRLQEQGRAVHTATVLDDLLASHDPEAMMVDWKVQRLKVALLQAIKRLQA